MTDKAARPVPFWDLTAYAVPGLSLSLLISPFPALLMAFYAKYTSATTAGIATIILFARIFNGVIDPPIGFLSDRTVSRWGPRKPWLVGGALFSVLAFWLAYIPPEGAGNGWFALAIVTFYLSHSIIDTPYRTWSGEISPDYGQRSRIAGAQTLTLLIGGVAFLALPEILSLPAIGILKTAALDRHAMAIFGGIGMVIMPLFIGIAVWKVPVGTVIRGKASTILEMRTIFTGNAPFRRFIIADFISAIGWAISYALLAITLDGYFGIGDKVVLFLLIGTAAQLASIPLCTRLANRFGKHKVYAWGQILNGVLLPLWLVFPPGGQANIPLMLCFGAVISALGTPNMMFPMALLSDIADYDTLKTAQRRNGTYFAMRTLLSPGGGAIGGAIGFYMLTIVGYDPSAKVHSQFATWGMLGTSTFLPMIAFIASGWLMLGYSITARRHAAIRKAIARRFDVETVGGDPSAVGELGALA